MGTGGRRHLVKESKAQLRPAGQQPISCRFKIPLVRKNPAEFQELVFLLLNRLAAALSTKCQANLKQPFPKFTCEISGSCDFCDLYVKGSGGVILVEQMLLESPSPRHICRVAVYPANMLTKRHKSHSVISLTVVIVFLCDIL